MPIPTTSSSSPLAPEPLDRQAHRGLNEDFRKAFSKMEHIVHEIVAEGDAVALRGTVRITHEGEFQGIPPTGKAIEVGFMDFLRIEDGRVREEWVELDAAGMIRALGAG